MTTAIELFEGALTWLAEHYGDWRFFQERDLVWVLQTKISDEIADQHLPYRVIHEYKIIGQSTDLAILNADNSVAVAAEFKYEPSRARSAEFGADIGTRKLPVVADWKDVEKDVQRVQKCVETGTAAVGYSIFVDEGRHSRLRPPFPRSEWIDWSSGPSVLLSRTP